MKEKPDLDKIAKEIEERYGIRLKKIREMTCQPAYSFSIKKVDYTIQVFQANEHFYHPGEWLIQIDIDGVNWGSGIFVKTMDELFEELERDRNCCPGLRPVENMQLRLF